MEQDVAALAEWIASSADWQRGLHLLGAVHANLKVAGARRGVGDERVHVRSRRSGPRFPGGAGHALKVVLARELEEQLGWAPCGQRRVATLEVQVQCPPAPGGGPRVKESGDKRLRGAGADEDGRASGGAARRRGAGRAPPPRPRPSSLPPSKRLPTAAVARWRR